MSKKRKKSGGGYYRYVMKVAITPQKKSSNWPNADTEDKDTLSLFSLLFSIPIGMTLKGSHKNSQK